MRPSEAFTLCWVEALWSDTLATRGDIERIRNDRRRLVEIRRRLHKWSPHVAGLSVLVCLTLLVVTSFVNPQTTDVFTALGSGFSACMAAFSVFVYVTTGAPDDRSRKPRRDRRR